MLKLRIRTVYLAVLAAAVLFRLGALWEFFHSPLAFYSRIPGLDMKTHLELGAVFARGEGVFAFYRLLAALVPEPAGLVILQCLAGCLTALFTVFAALRLSGSRWAALWSGLAAALYGNALLYELVTLPECWNVLITAGALAAVLQARRKQFAPGWCVPAGAALALMATGRPVGVIGVLAALLWMGRYLYRRRSRRGAAALAAGLLLVWIPVTLWNCRSQWPFPVYGSNFSYAARVAEQTTMTSWNVEHAPQKVSPLKILGSFCRKAPRVFSIREIPDNINYYFLKKRLDILKFSLPVALLVTLGVAGMVTLLCRRDRRGGLLMLWTLALAVIFAAYYPVGRYRLVLYPCFAIFAGYYVTALGRPGRRGLPILAGVLTAALQWAVVPHPAVERAADHTAWGMALLLENAPAEADAAFLEAVRLSGGGPRETGRMLHRLLLTNRPVEARRLLREYPGNDPYRRFYDALLDLGDGSALAARQKLESLQNAVPPEVTAQYYFFLGEACFRTGAGKEAAGAYRKLLLMTRSARQKQEIQARIRAAEALPGK